MENEKRLETPVLFLIFNRPESTRTVGDAILRRRPCRLYVAADGPRGDHPADAARCAEARRIVEDIDWDCDVRTLYRNDNLGCKRAVASAIDWFFETEEEGIILEDDCLPDDSFFSFTSTLLNTYRYDSRISVVSGNNFQNGIARSGASYYCSCFPHCWGWATWRRAWKWFDITMSLWPEAKERQFLRNVWSHPGYRRYWESIFDAVYSGDIDSWAYIWTLCLWLQSGLTLLPQVNLVRNIGGGPDATHTTGTDVTRESQSIDMPLVHPTVIGRDISADTYSMRHHFQVTRVGEVKAVVRNTIKRSTGLDVSAMKRKLRQRIFGACLS